MAPAIEIAAASAIESSAVFERFTAPETMLANLELASEVQSLPLEWIDAESTSFEIINESKNLEGLNAQTFETQVLETEVPYKSLEDALSEASEAELSIYEQAGLEATEVNDRGSLTRTDIDYDAQDNWGRTNLERMEQGLAPILDGEPIELHHIGQEMNSPLAELTPIEHRGPGNYSILHEVGKDSEINRTLFNAEKEAHWKTRAEIIKEGGLF